MLSNTLTKRAFSIFFCIAIAVHIYYVVVPDGKPFWWHVLYYLTYAICWWAILAQHKKRLMVYGFMAAFPFATHFYYAFRHVQPPDVMLLVCILVCVLLVLGFLFIRHQQKST